MPTYDLTAMTTTPRFDFHELLCPKYVTTIQTKDIKPEKNKYELPEIRHVHFNKETGHTAIVWKDGTSTVVHCGSDEKFEPYAGFCAAIVKKLFGSTTAAKRIMDSVDVEKVAEAKKEAHLKQAEETRAKEKKNHDRKIRSMVKRLKLAQETAELMMKECGLDKALMSLIGDADGDMPLLGNLNGDKPVDTNVNTELPAEVDGDKPDAGTV